MTKGELIREAAKRAGVTQMCAESVINAALEVSAEALADGQEIKLHQYGIIKVKERKPRTSRNFKTGEVMEIPSSKTVAFVPASSLKEAVNRERAAGNE